ncbi:MAG: hypothetical protein K8H88_10710, partial [Sandaracinaceae bacterium]|nr:hypothetical protein [Sandaracinaceae bacterium]
MVRRRPLFLLLALMAAFGLAACGPDAVLDRTVATLEIVRGGAHVGETAAARVVRLAAGEEQAFAIDEGSLARLSLDGGAQLLMDAGARARLDDEASLRIEAGRVFAETDAGVLLELGTAAGTLRIRDAAISLRVEGETLEAYVVRAVPVCHASSPRT